MVQDEERMAKLEDDLKHVRTKAEEADKQYDEVSKKLQVGGCSLMMSSPLDKFTQILCHRRVPCGCFNEEPLKIKFEFRILPEYVHR